MGRGARAFAAIRAGIWRKAHQAKVISHLSRLHTSNERRSAGRLEILDRKADGRAAGFEGIGSLSHHPADLLEPELPAAPYSAYHQQDVPEHHERRLLRNEENRRSE